MDGRELPLSIEVLELEDYAVITPVGYLNALTGEKIDKVCEELLSRDLHYIIINFSRIELINTIGISILVGIMDKVLNHQGLVYFTELGGTNREIFDVLNLTTVAMIFPDNAAAYAHMLRDRETLRRAMGG